MKQKFYVAYGSNLNVEQMAYRCPTAKFVGVGVIKNHQLQFKGSSFGAYATISPKENESVPVGVWAIQPHDEKRLDAYEGYPSHYFKQNIPVEMEDGRTANAMVYIMNLRMKFGMPSASYYKTVYQGYLDCGLDVDVLDKAVIHSTEKFYENQALDLQEEMREYNDEEETLQDNYAEQEELTIV